MDMSGEQNLVCIFFQKHTGQGNSEPDFEDSHFFASLILKLYAVPNCTVNYSSKNVFL